MPETPKDASMGDAEVVDLAISADAGDIGGGDFHMDDMGDTTDFYKEVDDADDELPPRGR